MNGIDASTWQALGLVLTVLGLLISVVLWKRRGPASGLRGVAWSLLPLAAGLTGTLRLLWQIGDAIVSWALRLVFSPVVWIGIAVAGVSLMLFAVSAAMRARGVGATGRGGATDKEPGGAELPGRRSSAPATRSQRNEPAKQDDDMDDIEAILRKHGIS